MRCEREEEEVETAVATWASRDEAEMSKQTTAVLMEERVSLPEIASQASCSGVARFHFFISFLSRSLQTPSKTA